MNFKNGFTLIELMIEEVIIAIIAAIAYPSYQQFILRSHAASAEAEMQKVAQELERFKSRNFSYRGYTPVTINVGNPIRYVLNIKATPTTELNNDGSGWVMRATPVNVKNDTYLFNSQGLRCRNKTASLVTFSTCGAGNENW